MRKLGDHPGSGCRNRIFLKETRRILWFAGAVKLQASGDKDVISMESCSKECSTGRGDEGFVFLRSLPILWSRD